jgi:hypothetical protein
MPAPDVYGDGLLDPLPDQNPFERIPYGGMLYVTDRKRAGPDDAEKYYVNDLGTILRLGVARIDLGKKEFTWEKAREISLLKSRTEKFPVKVRDVEEWGILNTSIPFFTDGKSIDGDDLPPDASDHFADQIRKQLERSIRKHVYIYVHGYKVVYENPVLIASELWHFLGYDGAFIAYAWPSTPSYFSYFKDTDTSQGYSRNFRLLLEFLAENTDAEEIHIVGFSNGTRLVARSLEQLALKHSDKSAEEIQRKLRISNVILVSSDIDRGVFGSYIADGLLNVPRDLTVYMSKYDRALGLSRFLTNRHRVGQMFNDGTMSFGASNLLTNYPDKISVINVSDAEGTKDGNGHDYFRSSPWTSSDILMTLSYNLTPSQRGLYRQTDVPVYTFPPDYVTRLWDALTTVDPDFADSYKAYKASLARNNAGSLR